MTPSPLLTPTQAAAHLQVGIKTLRRWTAEGRLPVIREGRLIRYPRAGLDRAFDGLEPERDEVRRLLRVASGGRRRGL